MKTQETSTPAELGAATGSQFLVWWLTEEDYCGFEPHQKRNPLRLPDYAWEQFCSRCGRAGRGRLWVPDHIKMDSLPVTEDDPRWTPELLKAGGIVIEARHADDCARWGGTITTLTLDRVDTANSD
jgi:hypothetical protein